MWVVNPKSTSLRCLLLCLPAEGKTKSGVRETEAQEQIKPLTQALVTLLGVELGTYWEQETTVPACSAADLEPVLMPIWAGMGVLQVMWRRKVGSVAFGEFPNKSLIQQLLFTGGITHRISPWKGAEEIQCKRYCFLDLHEEQVAVNIREERYILLSFSCCLLSLLEGASLP